MLDESALLRAAQRGEECYLEYRVDRRRWLCSLCDDVDPVEGATPAEALTLAMAGQTRWLAGEARRKQAAHQRSKEPWARAAAQGTCSLQERIDRLGWSVSRLAREAGMARSTVRLLRAGRRVNDDTVDMMETLLMRLEASQP